MERFSQFVRIFVDWVGEKSTSKREQMEKKSARLAHEQSGSLRVAELLEMDR